jgi:glutathione S-transferase
LDLKRPSPEPISSTDARTLWRSSISRGKVPTLVDGDLVLWESLAINLYLSQQYGGVLKPGSGRDLGLAYTWSFWAMGEFEGPIDAAARLGSTLAADWANSRLAILNNALRQDSWLAGETFGVADLNTAVLFQRPRLAEVDRQPHPQVHRWLKACRSRPAFARMVEIGRAASESVQI